MTIVTITLAKFKELYEKGLVHEVITVKDEIYGRSAEGAGDTEEGYIVVKAVLP